MSDDVLPPPQPPDCKCMARDGEPQDNDRWPEWLTAGCPVHDRAGAVREAGGQAGIINVHGFGYALRPRHVNGA